MSYTKKFELDEQSRTPREAILKELAKEADESNVPLKEYRKLNESSYNDIPVAPGTTSAMTNIGGVAGEWVHPKDNDNKFVFIYLHGGGYYHGSNHTRRSLSSEIARQCKASGFIVKYRLAPEHPFPAALEDSIIVYKSLLADWQPNQIVIMGDSAGGGLTASTMIKLRNDNLPLPACAVLLSPWTDLNQTGASMQSRAQSDPNLNKKALDYVAKWYYTDSDPEHPLVSPLYADLHDLPPTLIQVGDMEVLLDDSTRFAEQLSKNDNQVTLQVYDQMFHVWQKYFYRLPIAETAIKEIANFVEKHT